MQENELKNMILRANTEEAANDLLTIIGNMMIKYAKDVVANKLVIIQAMHPVNHTAMLASLLSKY